MIRTALSLPWTWLGNSRTGTASTPARPRFLTFLVTFACNARCRMCDSWKKSSGSDLTIEEIDRIFVQLPRMDIVRLSGGEPFLRKDLGNIAQLVALHLQPDILHITSNGFLTERIVTFCEERDKKLPLHLLLSIDAVGQGHDEIRGVAKAWDRVMATVRHLAPRQKELGLHLSVNQTILDNAGLEHYRDLRNLLQPLAINNQVVFAYAESATYSIRDEFELQPPTPGAFSPFGRHNPEELTAFFSELEKDLSALPLLPRSAKRYYLEGLANRLLHNRAIPNPRCVALTNHLRLYPDGRLPICQFNSTSIGNLRISSFDEIWQSETAAAGRRWVRKCPGCWAECEILPNALYSGDLFRRFFSSRRQGKGDR